jgi:hypothetical protein
VRLPVPPLQQTGIETTGLYLCFQSGDFYRYFFFPAEQSPNLPQLGAIGDSECPMHTSRPFLVPSTWSPGGHLRPTDMSEDESHATLERRRSSLSVSPGTSATARNQKRYHPEGAPGRSPLAPHRRRPADCVRRSALRLAVCLLLCKGTRQKYSPVCQREETLAVPRE